MTVSLHDALDRCPLVAIIRGVKPDEVEEIGAALIEAGIATVEVPLNSPQPIESIRRLASRFGTRALIGAGTVLSPADVDAVAGAGGTLIVMPHSDPAVITAAKRRSLWCVPGVATPTEAFAALAAGADALKLFPAEGMPPPIVKAWRAVMPPGTRMLAVGGVNADNMAAYLSAGAAGFGLGTSLYSPGKSASAVADSARIMVAAWQRAAGASGRTS